jgi:hypothetical protein
MHIQNGGRLNASNMLIDGPGLFLVQNNSLAEVSNNMIVNNGSAKVSTGSVLNVEKNLQIGTQGTVDLAGGGVVNVGFNNIGSPDGAVSVSSGGTLSGSGTILGNLFVNGETQPGFGNGGIVSPGNSPGTLNIDGNFFLAKGSKLAIEIQGTDPELFDKLFVTGTAEFEEGSVIEFDFQNGYLPKTGDEFAFIQTTGSTPTLNSLFSFSNLSPGFQYNTRFENGRFTLAALNDAQPVVPEPSSIFLLGTGLFGLAAARFRKRN